MTNKIKEIKRWEIRHQNIYPSSAKNTKDYV